MLKPLFGYTASTRIVFLSSRVLNRASSRRRVNGCKRKPSTEVTARGFAPCSSWYRGACVLDSLVVSRPWGLGGPSGPPKCNLSGMPAIETLSHSRTCPTSSLAAPIDLGSKGRPSARLLSSVIARNNFFLCGFLCGVLRAGNCRRHSE